MKKLILASQNPHKAREISEILGVDVMVASDVVDGFDPDECGQSFAQNAHIKALALADMVGSEYAVLADDSGLCVDALGGAPGIYSARWGLGRGISLDGASGVGASGADGGGILLDGVSGGASSAGAGGEISLDGADAQGAKIVDADAQNRAYLAAQLAAAGVSSSAGRFVCAMCLVVDGRCVEFDGVLEGMVIARERGENGFGYDSMFVPDCGAVGAGETASGGGGMLRGDIASSRGGNSEREISLDGKTSARSVSTASAREISLDGGDDLIDSMPTLAQISKERKNAISHRFQALSKLKAYLDEIMR